MSVLDRWRAAIAFAIAPRRRSFAGAQYTRLNAGDWIFATSRSAEADTKADLRQLRNRARELRKNSPFGARYTQVLVEGVLGDCGIRLQAKNQTLEGKLFTRANQAIEDAWEDAGTIRNWDVEKKLTRDEQLALSVGQWGDDGEILIRQYRGPRFGPYGYQAQVLDPDLLDETFNQERVGTMPRIVQGVEYDDLGAPAAYWLWNRHPSDSGGLNRERTRVPASDIIHTFLPMRAGQPRGIPHASAIMATLRMLDGYVEAELVAARTASAKMGAVVDSDPQSPSVRSPSAGGATIPAEAEPATLMDLRGQQAKLDLWDPQHPTAAFPDFMKTMARFIAVGYGISYHTLTGDLSDANYSSMKVGEQPERMHFKRLQRFVIDHVLQELYRNWLAMALLNGKITGVTDFSVERYTRVAWQPRGFASPDPLKDAQADYMDVAAGTRTLTEICAARGRDFGEVLEERKQELELLKAAGIESVLPIAKPKGASDTAEDGSGDAGDDTSGADESAATKKPRQLRMANA